MSNRRLIVVILLLVCACLVGGIAFYGKEPLQDGSLQEEASAPDDPPPKPRSGAARNDGAVDAALRVVLGPVARPVRPLRLVEADDLVATWPEPSIELPESRTTDLLRRIAFEATPIRDQAVHDLLVVAEEEGFVGALADGDSPGRAFVEMAVEQLRSDHVYLAHEVNAWARTHLRDGEDLRDRFGEIWLHAPDRPVQDLGALRELASSTLERFPAHPIADHARMYLVVASTPKGLRQGRDPVDLTEAVDVLADIDDPGLAEQAALRLTRIDPWMELSARGLDVLSATRGSTAGAELVLTEFAVDRAVRDGDWARVRDSSARYRAASEAMCPDGSDSRLSCRKKAAERLDVLARLAALTDATPETWQEVLVAAVWSCQLETDGQVGTSTSVGRWDGQWSWDSWDHPTQVTHCLASKRIDAPHPPAGTSVRLTLVSEDE